MSKTASGVLPIRFHPPGESSGYTPVWLPPMPTVPAGTTVRGVVRRGVASLGDKPPRYAKPGHEADHVHEVVAARVDPHDLVGGDLVRARHVVEVRTERAAVADGDLDDARRRKTLGASARRGRTSSSSTTRAYGVLDVPRAATRGS